MKNMTEIIDDLYNNPITKDLEIVYNNKLKDYLEENY